MIGPGRVLPHWKPWGQQLGLAAKQKPTSSPRQVDDVARGVSADIRAARDENLGAMDRSHYLTTAGVYAVLHQESVEVDALVA